MSADQPRTPGRTGSSGEPLVHPVDWAFAARTAEALGVPFAALRAVSDLCGPAAGQQFHLELDEVARTSALAVQELAARLARG